MKKLLLIFGFLIGLPTLYVIIGWNPESFVEKKIFDFFFLITIGIFAGMILNQITGIGERFIGFEKSAKFEKGKKAYDEKDYKTAIQIWKPLAEKGYAEAQFYLGWMYFNGEGVLANDNEAIKWYRKSAEKGYAEAQIALGWMYSHGRGSEKNYKESAKWYKKAATQGNMTAYNNLGWAYQEGEGVERNYEKAFEWYYKAADMGHSPSQNNVGSMYQKGIGVAKNNKEAVKWYRQAAKQGDHSAQNNLGFMHSKGIGGAAQDYEEAVRWYRKAAKQGNAAGQFNLSAMYFGGLGIKKSYILACMWLIIAEANGYEEAQEPINEVKGKLSAEEIKKAEKMARQCLESGYEKCFEDFQNE